MGKTPDRHSPKFWNEGTEPWISIADLTKCNKYIENTAEKITATAVDESGIKIIPKNTVIMSFKLSIGKVAITPKEMLRTTNGQSVSWDSHPSEDRSEPPLQRKDGSIIIPGICIVASSRTTRLL